MVSVNRKPVLVFFALSVFLLQMLGPLPARAEGEVTPTPGIEVVQVTVEEVPPGQTVEAAVIETPTLTATETEAPPTALEYPSVTPTIEMLPTLVSADPTDEVIEEQPLVALPILLDAMPDNTNVVVLGADGQPEPLVTIEAAEILATGDPVWCPAGQAPTPGLNGCTTSFSTFSDLLNYFKGYSLTQPTQDGTIWITTGSAADTSRIIIDGNDYFPFTTDDPEWDNFALTLQGGWSGISGDTVIGTNSVFSVPIEIKNWGNNITLANISVNDISSVSSNGVVNYIDNGVNITNISGDVTIQESSFEKNHWTGVFLDGVKDVVVADSRFNENYWVGLDIYNSQSITITNGEFNNNGTGLDVRYNDNINITGSTFNNNREQGIFLTGSGGVNIGQSTFDGNGNVALDLWVGSSSNNVYYSRITNNRVGVKLSSDTGGSLLLYCVQMSGNDIDFSATPPGIWCPGPSITPSVTPTPTSTPVGPLPIPIIVTEPITTIDLSCGSGSTRVYQAMLPNGDLLEIHCPVTGQARISILDNTALPENLPSGFEYVSAYAVDILQAQKNLPVINTGGYLRGLFIAEQNDAQYGILYWDSVNSRWVQLADYQRDSIGSPVVFPLNPANPVDGYKVLSGVRFLNQLTPNRLDVSVNFSGVFVVVHR